MRAFVQTGYGTSDVVVERTVDAPVPKDGEVLVAVDYASVAAGDVYLMRGRPFVARFAVGFPRPKRDYVVGLDFAGTVVGSGAGVTDFAEGERVFGECHGSCATSAVADAARIARAPDSIPQHIAAASVTSACTALQAVRDCAKVTPGMRVLINGATGGVGTFAVQFAKAFGAEVTAVCSAANAELVASLGADHAIDYAREDFTKGGARYDAIIDIAASHGLSETRKALVPDGILVPVSGRRGVGWIAAAALTAPFVKQQGAPLNSINNAADLGEVARFLDDGTVSPMIDRTYDFGETREALAYVDAGHARGKVVVRVGGAEG